MENSIIELGKLTNEKGSFCDGDWVESKDQDPNGQVRLIQMADIGVNEYKNKSQRFLTEEKYHELKCTEIKPGDILISRMPDPIGRACIFPGDEKKCITVVDVAILRPDDSIVDRNWLCHIVNSPLVKSQIEQSATGTTRKRISGKNLKKIKIPLPPLATQKKIAALLDAADALRQKTRQIIQEYDRLAQAIFLDMFGDPVTNPMGWEKKSTIEYCDCIVPGRDKPKSFTGDIPWVTTDDLFHLGETIQSKKGIGLNAEEIKQVKAKVIPANSVIMTCVGDLGIVTINKNEIVINQQLHSFQCHQELNPIFLMYNLSYQKPYFYKMASNTTVPYLNKTNCNNTPTILPPISLQTQFAEKLALIEQQKKLAQKSLTESEDLFNALLQKAFKGELVKA